MPGPGSKAPGNGANDNYNAWRKIKLNMDTIVENIPVDTSTSFLGHTFSLPLMTAPIGSIRLQYNITDDVSDFNEKCMAACQTKGIMTAKGALKAVEAGADMCLICRPVLISYYGGGQEGIECYIDKIQSELSDTMYMCGARSIAQITLDMIRF